MAKAIKHIDLLAFDINEHLNDIFLIGGYRVKKGQDKWIFGEKPERDYYLYNTRFAVEDTSCRNGSMGTGELPNFIVVYDYTNKTKVRLFDCLEYSIKTHEEMQEMKYPQNSRYTKKHSYIVYKLGREFDPKNINIPTIIKYAHDKYPAYEIKEEAAPVIITGNDILRANQNELPLHENLQDLRIVDLFAGLGGFHHALDKLGREMGFRVECVFASELQEDLRRLYEKNYHISYDKINSDITSLSDDEIIEDKVPEHDILCGGFPCQPFSKAGKQQGFDDEEGRGVLFNYIADIIRVRRPRLIFLENVSNLETHDEGKTWATIQKRLKEELNYDIKSIVISPHEYGYPQYRKRIYIVGIDGNEGNLDDFKFPIKPIKATCNIHEIIEKNPTNPQPLKEIQRQYIDVWQQFLDLCCEHHAKLPAAPIWAMEFGADYDFEDLAPAFQRPANLRGRHGKLGILIEGDTKAKCISLLPKYAQTNKNESFPDWKKKFIRENRKFYADNREWIDVWKQQIVGWENSFMKFEWNCDETDHMTIDDKILQFRPSGLRVKRPTYSPALTFMSSQVPIFPGATYMDAEGNEQHGRFMTMVEAARIQGMGDLSFEGLNKARIYEALGNAVDVEIVKIIAKDLIKYANR
jgi:DNA (cytosine-5)-methyltransferase 1